MVILGDERGISCVGFGNSARCLRFRRAPLAGLGVGGASVAWLVFSPVSRLEWSAQLHFDLVARNFDPSGTGTTRSNSSS